MASGLYSFAKEDAWSRHFVQICSARVESISSAGARMPYDGSGQQCGPSRFAGNPVQSRDSVQNCSAGRRCRSVRCQAPAIRPLASNFEALVAPGRCLFILLNRGEKYSQNMFVGLLIFRTFEK